MGKVGVNQGRMMDLAIRVYQDSDEPQVVALWRDVLPDDSPHNDPALVIQKKQAVEDGLFFVAIAEKSELAGTVMGGYDGHRGWVYAVAVSPKYRRRGIGRALISTLERVFAERGCLKINLQVRTFNQEAIAFYEKLGYEIEPRISMGKRL